MRIQHWKERILRSFFQLYRSNKTEDIIRCEADSNYSRLFLLDGKTILVSRTLGDFEDILQYSGFVRIHHMNLINIKHIIKYIKGEGGQVVMRDGSAIDISRRKKEDFLNAISDFGII